MAEARRVALFVEPGKYLVIYVPAFSGIVPLVVEHSEPQHNWFKYGEPPVNDGVVPGATTSGGRVFTGYITFQLADKFGIRPESARDDLFYHVEPNVVYHVELNYKPDFLKAGVMVPPDQWTTFLHGRSLNPAVFATGLAAGFKRGSLETVYPPHIRVGYFLANDASFSVKANLWFRWAKYEVKILADPEAILAIMWGEGDVARNAYRVTLGGASIFGAELWNTWGVQPLPILPRHVPRDKALAIIREWIEEGRRRARAKNVWG